MLKKKLSIIFIISIFILSTIFLVPHEKEFRIIEVTSPLNFKLNNEKFEITDLETFDAFYSTKNKKLAKELNITESEAFVLGNLAKDWASSLMKGRNVLIKNKNDLVYDKYSYREKFLYSGFCIKNSKPYYKEAFEQKLKQIKRANYKVLDLNTEKIYKLDDAKVRNLNNFIIINKSHLLRKMKQNSNLIITKNNDIKIYLTDSTSNFKPNRNCSTLVCKEILNNINNAQKTIDIAIYGYSRVYAIEDALKNAIDRGVKIRLVYDLDSNGKNIYPDTDKILSLIKNNKSDKDSKDARNIMHNKFYIFDDEILITGSANLSHTDMSGFNSNSVISIKSPKIAKVYKKEFEQMYNGKFHSEKVPNNIHKFSISDINLEIYFSPQDKSITNAVLPLIKNAQKYIYIPTFVLTEKRITKELIKAKNRGVDVKILIDALNASIKHSKHKELREGGILVKTENYAGKMHSKSIIIDDEYTIIGSMNFSNSGENRNDENIIIINDSNIAKSYKEFFLYQWAKIDDRWLYNNVRTEGIDSIGSCYDGIDNNYDGLTDKDDPACKLK